MAYRPEEVYLGVADVFVVMVPGAVAVAATGWVFSPRTVGTFTGSASAWWLLVLGSYIVGHLVSGVAAWEEDWFSGTPWGTRRLATEAKHARPRVAAKLKVLLGYEVRPDRLRRMAAVIVHITSPDLRLQLSRRDADRRFFRNFTTIGALVVMEWLAAHVGKWRGHAPFWQVMPAAFASVVFGFLRYRAQDRKYTRDVFDYFLTLDGLRSFTSLTSERPAPSPGSPAPPES